MLSRADRATGNNGFDAFQQPSYPLAPILWIASHPKSDICARFKLDASSNPDRFYAFQHKRTSNAVGFLGNEPLDKVIGRQCPNA